MACFTPRARAHRLLVLALASAALLCATSPATAFELLTRDKDARFASDAGGHGWARIHVGADRALRELTDPRCPAASTIRISAYRANRVTGDPVAELPCALWHKVPGGYLYSDPGGHAAGVRSVRYTTRGLDVYAASPGQTPVTGPVGFAQVNLNIGDRRFLVRFHAFAQNEQHLVVAR